MAPGTTGDPREEILETLCRTERQDLSCYDRAFLEKTIEHRRKVAAGETPAAYRERLAEDDAEAIAARSP